MAKSKPTTETLPAQQPAPPSESRGLAPSVGRSMGELFSHDRAAFAHNYDGSPQEIFRFISIAKNGEHKSLQDMSGATIKVRHFYAHAIELESDSGEITDAKRIVLFSPHGQTYECVSMGVFDTLSDAVGVYEADDWARGIEFKVGNRKTRRGFRIMTLLPTS